MVLKQVVMRHNSGIRWAIENGLFTFQVGSIWNLIDATESWSLAGIAKQIICPTLVCEAESDQFFAEQPQMLYDALTCPKTFMRFTTDDGAEEHCQFGALLLCNHRVFEWLDATLGVSRENAAQQWFAADSRSAPHERLMPTLGDRVIDISGRECPRCPQGENGWTFRVGVSSLTG